MHRSRNRLRPAATTRLNDDHMTLRGLAMTVVTLGNQVGWPHKCGHNPDGRALRCCRHRVRPALMQWNSGHGIRQAVPLERAFPRLAQGLLCVLPDVQHRKVNRSPGCRSGPERAGIAPQG
jgi:hypothetical protein